jgi:protein-tyrosine phosphatase
MGAETHYTTFIKDRALFMVTFPFWINAHLAGGLGVSSRPRGGDWLEDEIAAWRRIGVNVVVSLLTADEATKLELDQEGKVCKSVGITFRSLPIEDRTVPNSIEEVKRLLDDLSADLTSGRNIVIHCRQGIGRSGLIAIGLLLRMRQSLDGAIRSVSAARGLKVPETPEQLEWLRAHQKAISGPRHDAV